MVFAPKGLKDSAQGFNPGNHPNKWFALKGREMRTRLTCVVAPLQGAPPVGRCSPGLKPRAEPRRSTTPRDTPFGQDIRLAIRQSSPSLQAARSPAEARRRSSRAEHPRQRDPALAVLAAVQPWQRDHGELTFSGSGGDPESGKVRRLDENGTQVPQNSGQATRTTIVGFFILTSLRFEPRYLWSERYSKSSTNLTFHR